MAAHGTFDFLQLLLATAAMEEVAQLVAVVAVDSLVLLLASIYLSALPAAPDTLNAQLSTRNLQPSTRNPHVLRVRLLLSPSLKSSTLNPQPEPEPWTLSPERLCSRLCGCGFEVVCLRCWAG